MVLSTGLAQWSTFPDHREHLMHNVRDDEDVPQKWMNDWVNATSHLLRLFSNRAMGRACVVYRAHNIAARHTNLSDPKHHPSAFNGFHHWQNRIGLALAKYHGLQTVDLTNVTIHMKASAHSLDVSKPERSRRADAGEGDVYHGYPLHILAPRFLSALADACCSGSTTSN